MPKMFLGGFGLGELQNSSYPTKANSITAKYDRPKIFHEQLVNVQWTVGILRDETFLTDVPWHGLSMLSNFLRTVLQILFLSEFTKMVKYTRQITAADFNGTIVKSWNQTVSNALNDYWQLNISKVRPLINLYIQSIFSLHKPRDFLSSCVENW